MLIFKDTTSTILLLGDY